MSLVSIYVRYAVPCNKNLKFAEQNDGGGGGRKMMAGSFSIRVITVQWFMFFSSLLIMSMAGATFMFGLYSGEIKSSLGYDQTTLNLLSFFKDLGGNIGIISGLSNEITPPWVVLSMGAAMNFVGYFMIWLSVTKSSCSPFMADVSVHMHRSKFSVVCQYRSTRHVRQELP